MNPNFKKSKQTPFLQHFSETSTGSAALFRNLCLFCKESHLLQNIDPHLLATGLSLGRFSYVASWAYFFLNIVNIENGALISQMETPEQSGAHDGVLIFVFTCPAGRSTVSAFKVCDCKEEKEAWSLNTTTPSHSPTKKLFSGPPSQGPGLLVWLF